MANVWVTQNTGFAVGQSQRWCSLATTIQWSSFHYNLKLKLIVVFYVCHAMWNVSLRRVSWAYHYLCLNLTAECRFNVFHVWLKWFAFLNWCVTDTIYFTLLSWQICVLYVSYCFRIKHNRELIIVLNVINLFCSLCRLYMHKCRPTFWEQKSFIYKISNL